MIEFLANYVDTQLRLKFPGVDTATRQRIPRIALDTICFAVLCIILSLGLWPFRAPKNNLTWLDRRNGLHLGRPATIIGAAPLSNPQGEAAATVEVWLQPERIWDSATFLAFYSPGAPHRLSLRQSQTDLELQTARAHFYVTDAFRKAAPVFLTITSGASGIAVYINGSLVKSIPQFSLSPNDLTGLTILGDSPAQPDNWSGDLLGLAIFRRELTPGQVRDHYRSWTLSSQPQISPEERNVALYLFDERAGRVVHDRSSRVDLNMPERYQVLDKLFLEPVWSEFSFSRSYVDSAIKNIVGFLPFGFCFFPCLWLHKAPRPALIAVILGTLTSVTIEVLQAYLPTRDSGTTDILTNTLGTYLGVVLYRTLDAWLSNHRANTISRTDH